MAVEDTINSEVTAALATPLETLTDRFVSNQPYTATAFAQIAVWLRDNDDPKGAALVEQFARQFAKHEATTL